jgi:hypothetical protein
VEAITVLDPGLVVAKAAETAPGKSSGVVKTSTAAVDVEWRIGSTPVREDLGSILTQNQKALSDLSTPFFQTTT